MTHVERIFIMDRTPGGFAAGGHFVPETEILAQHGHGYVGENGVFPVPHHVDPIKDFAHELVRATRNRSVETFFEEEDRVVRTEEVLRGLVEQGRITIKPRLRGIG